MADNKTTIYEPDTLIKKSFIFIFFEILHDLSRNRWLIYQLFKRDFLAMYKQTFMGVLWAFIIPLISAGTVLMLNRAGLFTIGDLSVPYAIYAVFGLAFWQLFATGLIASTDSLAKAGLMIVKINFSKKALVIATYAQCLVAFVVQLIFLMILFLVYHKFPGMKIFLIPVLAIPLILFSLGISFIFALMNVVLRDIGNALAVIVTFLMFLTPVLYGAPKSGVIANICKYNPLYYLISVPRDFILFGKCDEFVGFLIFSLLSLLVFTGGFIIFHITETRIAERI